VKLPHIDIREGLTRVITITAGDDKNIFIRNYELPKKTDSIFSTDDLNNLVPDVGASFDLIVRRTKLANDEQYKKACKQLKFHKAKHEKNLKTTALGETRGRLYVERQNLDSLALLKRKKLKKSGSKPQKPVMAIDNPKIDSAQVDVNDI